MPVAGYTVVGGKKKRDTNLAVRTGGAPTHPLPKKPKKKKTYADALKTKKRGRPKQEGESLASLRKRASDKRKKECPPVSNMKKAQLIAFLAK